VDTFFWIEPLEQGTEARRLDVANDGNWSATKKVYGHREGRGEKSEEKDPTQEQSSGPSQGGAAERLF